MVITVGTFKNDDGTEFGSISFEPTPLGILVKVWNSDLLGYESHTILWDNWKEIVDNVKKPADAVDFAEQLKEWKRRDKERDNVSS